MINIKDELKSAWSILICYFDTTQENHQKITRNLVMMRYDEGMNEIQHICCHICLVWYVKISLCQVEAMLVVQINRQTVTNQLHSRGAQERNEFKE
jgi:hypothetical protein